MITRARHTLDADGQILGRLSTQIVRLLTGKHKPDYIPNLDSGDYVVVTNADRVKLSGRKEFRKLYSRHSMYPGGFKQITAHEQRLKDPRRLITHAVAKMLPKNKLRAGRLRRLTYGKK